MVSILYIYIYIYIYVSVCVCVCMYMKVISINHTTRPIHRLIRIKFGLHSLPTERMIGLGRLKLQQMSGESIEVKDLENGKNLVRKSWKTVKIWQNKGEKMSKFSDLAKSNKILVIFSKISARSNPKTTQILPDLQHLAGKTYGSSVRVAQIWEENRHLTHHSQFWEK